MLFHMRTASFDAGPTIHRRPAPGSVYRSPQVYAKLRAVIDADNATADAVRFASVFFFWLASDAAVFSVAILLLYI